MEPFRELLRRRTAGRGELARLARESGIAAHVIGRWRDGVEVNGKPVKPSLDNLEKIAPALGYSYAELMHMCGYLPGGEGANTADFVDPEERELVSIYRSVEPAQKPLLRAVIGQFRSTLREWAFTSPDLVAAA